MLSIMKTNQRNEFVESIQQKAVTKWASKEHTCKGVFSLGTGVGKTKTAIMAYVISNSRKCLQIHGGNDSKRM